MHAMITTPERDMPVADVEGLAAHAADAAHEIAAIAMGSYHRRLAAIAGELGRDRAEALQAMDSERPFAATEPYLGFFGLRPDEEGAACAQLLAREADLLARIYRHRLGRGPGREFALGEDDLPRDLQDERDDLARAFTFLEDGGGSRR